MAPSPTKFKASDLLTREGLERLAKQSLSWLRDYLTAIKSGQLHPFTQIERKTREATRDEPWGPTGVLLNELAEATRDRDDALVIFAVLEFRLSLPEEKWRCIYKVTEFLAKRGSELCVTLAKRDLLPRISQLTDFEHVTPDGKDVGINVKMRSRAVVALLTDAQGLTQQRLQHQVKASKEYAGYSRTQMAASSAAGSGSGGYSGGARRGTADSDDDHEYASRTSPGLRFDVAGLSSGRGSGATYNGGSASATAAAPSRSTVSDPYAGLDPYGSRGGSGGAASRPPGLRNAGETKGVTLEENNRHLAALRLLLQRPENRCCADCQCVEGSARPTWASINTGAFLCMRCAGIHRSLGAHISKVRSCTLDTWLPEQVAFMAATGNKVANAFWEADITPGVRPARDSIDLDRFIRLKYTDRKWAVGSWPPSGSTPWAAAAATAAGGGGQGQGQGQGQHQAGAPQQQQGSGVRGAVAVFETAAQRARSAVSPLVRRLPGSVSPVLSSSPPVYRPASAAATAVATATSALPVSGGGAVASPASPALPVSYAAAAPHSSQRPQQHHPGASSVVSPPAVAASTAAQLSAWGFEDDAFGAFQQAAGAGTAASAAGGAATTRPQQALPPPPLIDLLSDDPPTMPSAAPAANGIDLLSAGMAAAAVAAVPALPISSLSATPYQLQGRPMTSSNGGSGGGVLLSPQVTGASSVIVTREISLEDDEPQSLPQMLASASQQQRRPSNNNAAGVTLQVTGFSPYHSSASAAVAAAAAPSPQPTLPLQQQPNVMAAHSTRPGVTPPAASSSSFAAAAGQAAAAAAAAAPAAALRSATAAGPTGGLLQVTGAPSHVAPRLLVTRPPGSAAPDAASAAADLLGSPLPSSSASGAATGAAAAGQSAQQQQRSAADLLDLLDVAPIAAAAAAAATTTAAAKPSLASFDPFATAAGPAGPEDDAAPLSAAASPSKPSAVPALAAAADPLLLLQATASASAASTPVVASITTALALGAAAAATAGDDRKRTTAPGAQRAAAAKHMLYPPTPGYTMSPMI